MSVPFVITFCASFIQLICGSPLVRWVEQGNDVILYCNLGGTEESFDWTRGPNYTASTQHLLAYNNGGVVRGAYLTNGKCELLGRNLKVKDAQISDEDTYYCGTPKSYTSVILNVTIQPSAPTINNCNENKTCTITFPVGFVLHLICVIRGSRPAAELSWRVNEHEVTNITAPTIYLNPDGTFDTVTVLHIKHNAPTIYKCEAHGPSIQQSWKATAKINVTGTVNSDSLEYKSRYPEIDFCRRQSNCSITWPGGFPLQLQCTVRGAQNAIKLSWWHNNEDSFKNTTYEIHRDKHGYTIVSTITLHIRESSSYYCVVPEDSSLSGGETTSFIVISPTGSFPLEYRKDKSHTGRKGKRPNIEESKVAQESNDKENDMLLKSARDETDIGRRPNFPEENSKACHPVDNNTSLSSNVEASPHESSSSRDSTSTSEGNEPRVSAAASYPSEKENVSDSNETTTDMSSPTTSEKGAVVPWSEGVTVETGEFYEKLSSPKNTGRLITANLIRSKRHSFNFSLEDQKSDIMLKFSMKGYGLIISFVPYLGPCDEGYIIHFQEQGEITFNKHGMKIDLSDDENRYDPSKKLNFILNTASKKVLLMEVDDDNHNKPLLRYKPVQTELCSYVVISAHENSKFDMVLFPLR